MVKLRTILGEALKTFEAVDTIERATFVSFGRRIQFSLGEYINRFVGG